MRVKDKGDLYVHQDANWNVIALTDLGGSVVERYVYKPYGEVTVHQDTGYGDVDSTDKGTVGSTCTGTVSAACRILDLDFDGVYSPPRTPLRTGNRLLPKPREATRSFPSPLPPARSGADYRGLSGRAHRRTHPFGLVHAWPSATANGARAVNRLAWFALGLRHAAKVRNGYVRGGSRFQSGRISQGLTPFLHPGRPFRVRKSRWGLALRRRLRFAAILSPLIPTMSPLKCRPKVAGIRPFPLRFGQKCFVCG